MATKIARYLRQAAANVATARTLATAKPARCQWAVVCLFYAGLHYVNAYLHHTTGTVPKSHGDRGRNVQQHMSSIYTQYMMLKNESELARYMMKYHKAGQFQSLEQRLLKIEQFVRAALPTKGGGAP